MALILSTFKNPGLSFQQGVALFQRGVPRLYRSLWRFDIAFVLFTALLSVIVAIILYNFTLSPERDIQHDNYVHMRSTQSASMVSVLFASHSPQSEDFERVMKKWYETQPYLRRVMIYQKDQGDIALVYSWTSSKPSPNGIVSVRTAWPQEDQEETLVMIGDWDTAPTIAATNDILGRMISLAVGLAIFFVVPMLFFFQLMVMRHVRRLSVTTSNTLTNPDQVWLKHCIAPEMAEMAEIIDRAKSTHRRDQDVRQQSLRLQGYLNAIISNAFDGIVVLDEAGRIETLNPVAEEILGASEVKAQGQVFEDMLDIVERRYPDGSSDVSKIKPSIKPLKKRSNARFDIEIMRLRAGDGEERYLESSRTKFDAEGDHFSMITLRDVTSRQRQTDYLEQARKQSEDAAKAKTQFLAMMSHEIRTPLNGIIGILQLLQNPKARGNLEMYIDQGMQSAENLKRIIGDLLDVSRIEAGKVVLEAEHFSPRQIAEEEVALAQNLLGGKNIHLRCKIDHEIPHKVDGDSGKIRQVIRNMLSNAIKFTDQGSVLLVMKVLPQGDATRVRLFFSVQDTGIGIPVGKEKEVFSEFESVDLAYTRSFGGTGLGMAISKGLVEAMDGKIGFVSELNKGANFWFSITLPVVAIRERKSAVHAESVESHHALNGLRVLVVEDNPTNSLIARHMLEQEKCKVMTAADGIEALEMLNKFPYDVVLMDVAMPRMDGLSTSRKVRESKGPLARLPIIAMTAHVAKEDILAAKRAGMNDYLTKPLDRRLLLAALKKWGDEAAKASPD